MQYLTETQSNQNNISLLDLVLTLSNAKDLFIVCQEMYPATYQDSVELTQLHSCLKSAVTVLIETFSRGFCKKISAFASKLSTAEVGNALGAAKKTLDLIQDFTTKLLGTVQKRDFFVDSCLGMQLFEKLLKDKKSYFIQLIMDTKPAKLSEESEKKIADILVDFNNDDDLVQLSIPEKEIGQILKDINAVQTAIIEKFELKKFGLALSAFNELLKTNGTFVASQLTKLEVEHLSQILKNHLKDTTSVQIVQMVNALMKIAPLLDFKMTDFQALLDDTNLLNKAEIVARFFTTSGAQVHKTYEGLGSAINAYVETQIVFEKNILPLAKTAKPELKAQIEKYHVCLTNYFQLSMRFVMPLEACVSYCSALSKTLAEKNSKSPLVKTLEQTNTAYNNVIQILKQKSLVINGFKEITDFINTINAYLNNPPAENFIEEMLNKKYKAALNELRIYLISISQSSRMVEDFLNYHGVFKKIQEIFKTHGIDLKLKDKDPKKCNEPEKILATILKRYSNNVEKFQDDVKIVSMEK